VLKPGNVTTDLFCGHGLEAPRITRTLLMCYLRLDFSASECSVYPTEDAQGTLVHVSLNYEYIICKIIRKNIVKSVIY